MPVHTEKGKLLTIELFITLKLVNGLCYLKSFENMLPDIFDSLNRTWSQIDGRMKSESFKLKVVNCIRAWEDRLIYPNDYLVNLQNRFLGLVKSAKSDSASTMLAKNSEGVSQDENQKSQDQYTNSDSESNDVDGVPLEENDEDEDLDGSPLDGKPSKYTIFN
jgi:U2-associated protein SR140